VANGTGPGLRGLGASPGRYSGPARVIVEEGQFEQVRPGEVLICPQTSPTWTILFGRIGALVTDEGGILSHSAIAAREFGIPAVLATRTGTRQIATGQHVEVDGQAGTVAVLGARRPAGHDRRDGDVRDASDTRRTGSERGAGSEGRTDSEGRWRSA
jgi:pyruvate,water dikinase